MKSASAQTRRLTGVVLLYVLVMALAVFAGPGGGLPAPAQAQEPAASEQKAPEQPSFEQIKATLDEIESTVGDDNVSADKLAEARQKINELASTLQDQLAEIEPRAKEAAERLKQLGPAPGKDDPAESEDVAKDRKELTAEAADLEGDVKQGHVLLLRTDQLSERISEKRHALYARELFARTQSILDPHFWMEAANALPIEGRRLDGMLFGWREAVENVDDGNLWVAAAIIGTILLLGAFSGRWLWPVVEGARPFEGTARAWRAFRVFVFIAARASLVAIAALFVLRQFGLLTFRTEQIMQAMMAGIAAIAVGRGLAVAVFSPRRPERRLAPVDDRTAELLAGTLVWGTVAFAMTIALQAVHKAAFAPLVITVATNALFAAVAAGLLSGMAAKFGQIKRQHGANGVAAQWLHPLALIMAGIISAALVAGFASFAAFLGLRAVVAAVVFAALYLLLELTKAAFGGSAELSSRREAVAAHLGVTEQGLGLIGSLLSGAVRLLLVALAAVVIIGPWEISTADLFDTIRNVPFGFKIEDIHLSLVTVAGALAGLAVLIALTRVAQRWLESEVLPRTKLEPSLQQSISTIFGYVGIIAAIALALGNIGIDLQKIALVAGALSVGIGFGLQSIVSNFVSGLILLAERPIRPGDSIVVKGEEGWVRRVRVRATEIETFDRASVIIPNSELITGVVKNWTRANTLGRVVIKVGAPYSADPDRVRDLLVGVARAHPQVVASPAPGAFLLGFGQSALEFELRCIVADVEKALSVKSDLHFAVIKALRAEGIDLGPGPDPQLVESIRRQLLADSEIYSATQGIRRAG